MIAAARLARTPVRLSVDPDLWERVRAQAPPSAWLPPSAPVVIETWDELVERCRAGAVTGRLRVLGVERRNLPGALAGTDVTVLAAPEIGRAQVGTPVNKARTVC